MPKKKDQAEKKRNEIIKASLELFFEKGYEATSIRSIQSKIGSPVSLFYHYFDSKDQVFEEAIILFFHSYEMEMKKIVSDASSNPKSALKIYIDYIYNSTQEFREKYLGVLHWTILSAIREYTINIMRKYILEILCIYKKEKIIDIANEKLEIFANLIAFGVGGSILYQNRDDYLKQESEIIKEVKLILDV